MNLITPDGYIKLHGFFVLTYIDPGNEIYFSLHGCALTHSMVNYTKAIVHRADSGGEFIPSSSSTNTYTYENNKNNSVNNVNNNVNNNNNMPSSNKSALSSIESFLQLIDQLLVPAGTKTCLLIPIYFVILISYLFTFKNYMNKLIK